MLSQGQVYHMKQSRRHKDGVITNIIAQGTFNSPLQALYTYKHNIKHINSKIEVAYLMSFPFVH